MKTFRLNGPQFIDPGWFNAVKGGRHRVVIAPTGAVVLKGVEMRIVGVSSPDVSPEKSLPRPGTEVEVWLADQFMCASVVDVEHAAEVARQERVAREQRMRQQWDAARDEAIAFNASLRLPVAWDVGIKDVLSGLADGSWGDGRNRATVNHVLLKQPLTLGRLQRNKGDFLCSSSQALNGKRWAGQTQAKAYDGAGSEYQPKVTCRKCVGVALRFAASCAPVANTVPAEVQAPAVASEPASDDDGAPSP